MSVKDSISEMRRQIKDQRKALQQKIRDSFADEGKLIFEQHPTLKGFRWNQYTPYFNDGDECTFSAHTDYVKLKVDGLSDDDGDADDDGYVEVCNYKGCNTPKETLAILKTVEGFLSAFEDEELRSLFGDHKEITVTAKGVKVEGYDHD